MATNEQGYNNFRIPVPEAFEEVFSHFYFAANNTEKILTKTLLPSYQTILIFSFGSKTSLTSNQNTRIEVDKCLVLGPIKQAFDYTLSVGAQILVANFKADAFYRFFGNVILSDLFHIDPDELIDENCFTNLWHVLKKMDSPFKRVELILEFCQPYLRKRNATTEILSNFKNEALNPIKSVATELRQSERNIQLNHKKYFGFSAKEINRYQRFLKAIEIIQATILNSSKPDWFEVIDRCGYYDQSQLIHDFKHFINLSPTQFVKFQKDICIANPVK